MRKLHDPWNVDSPWDREIGSLCDKGITAGNRTFKLGETIYVKGDPNVGDPGWIGQFVDISENDYVVLYDKRYKSLDEVPLSQIVSESESKRESDIIDKFDKVK